MRRVNEPMDFVKSPTERQQENSHYLRERFKALRGDILALCPESRERSIAITHLEDAQSRSVQAVMYFRLEDEPDE